MNAGRAVASGRAGAVSRAGAFVIDGVIVNLSFTALVAVATLLLNYGGGGGDVSNFAIAIGSWPDTLGAVSPGQLCRGPHDRRGAGVA